MVLCQTQNAYDIFPSVLLQQPIGQFSLFHRYKREAGGISIEKLAEMDEYDCGKQYLCEMTAIQATEHNVHDPLLIRLLQVNNKNMIDKIYRISK